MVLIFLILSMCFLNCGGMEIPFAVHAQDLLPEFEPCPHASSYKILANKPITTDVTNILPHICPSKKYAFLECMNQIRANISITTLKLILDDPVLTEAVLAYAKPYTLRNEYVEQFFFASLMWNNPEVYALLLEKKVDLVNIRSTYGDTPAEFVKKLQR